MEVVLVLGVILVLVSIISFIDTASIETFDDNNKESEEE